MDYKVEKARSYILDAGKSSELEAALRSIAEVTVAGGASKYAPRVCRQLAQIVVCRTYAKPVLQLCHLVVAARACGPGRDNYETLFFDGRPSTAQYFRTSFERTLSSDRVPHSSISFDTDGIEVSYGKGVFHLSFSRMPLLSALLEFLIGLHGYLTLDDIFGEMLFDTSKDTAVRKAANRISRLTYQGLSRHLPTSQNTAKFREIMSFLEQRANNGTVLIDDHAILEFWRARDPATKGSLGEFRAFRTVFKAFVALLRALELGETRGAVAQAIPVGGDVAAGEIDPDSLLGPLDLPGQWQSPLPLLDEEPVGRIQFLTKRQKEGLRSLMDLGPMSRQLPLSLLRVEVFGKHQSRISQALRQKRGPRTLDRLACCSDTESYATYRKEYCDLQAELNRLLTAVLHVLLHGQRIETAQNVEALPMRNPATVFYRASKDSNTTADSAELDAVMQDARKAFHELSRKGFDDATLSDPILIEGFRIGADVLHTIAEQIEGYLNTIEHIDQSATDLDCWYRHDTEIFRYQFERLYGEGP